MKNIELMREYMRLVEAGEKKPWRHFELYLPIAKEWVTMCSCSWFTDWDIESRSKPKTININGFDVPKPETEFPSNGSDYYIADTYEPEYFTSSMWFSDYIDIALLKKGVVHLTKEAAIQHAKALLSFTAKSED